MDTLAPVNNTVNCSISVFRLTKTSSCLGLKPQKLMREGISLMPGLLRRKRERNQADGSNNLYYLLSKLNKHFAINY